MGLLDQTQQEYYDGNDHGNYQFTSLDDVINQFIVAYVGEDKIISKIKRTDVAFHAQRAMQELSFDTFKSCKAQEITVPASLQMTLPQDYVNYTKISWVDSAGIKHLLYPTSKTSNPTNYLQNSDGDFQLDNIVGKLLVNSSTITLSKAGAVASTLFETKDVLVGLAVTGMHIPAGSFVASTDNSANKTIITLEDISGTAVVTTNIAGVSDIPLRFYNRDGSLFLPQAESHIIKNLSWNTTEFTITGTADELTDLKPGMILYNEDFPLGTVIISVYNFAITVDQPATTAVTSGGEITFVSPDLKDSDTWASYKSATPSENQDDYQDDTYWPLDGSRYGLDPQHAQANGSFYIDCVSGKIHFSSNISGKTVILDYISDSLGADGEMQVHKFAEEAMYKWISHAVMSGRANVPEYQVSRLKKERFAAIRTAKLRLSNIKLEEITQILRGKSKQIKH